MRHRSLVLALATLLPIGALAPACTSSGLSSKGQEITCTTDPGTGAIASCSPGGGSGGSNECHDIDEDGDGEPHDEAGSGSDDSGHHGGSGSVIAPGGGSDDGSGSGSDSDGDGIPDGEDCDHHHGEDDDAGDELPYDVRPALGSTAQPIQDAFAEKGGGQPAEIVSVTMEGGTWRLTELQAGTAFLVEQDDCDHTGNRDIGRDRVFVTWRDTAAAVTQTDHLDIRYCK
jgi:hypothetical protein